MSARPRRVCSMRTAPAPCAGWAGYLCSVPRLACVPGSSLIPDPVAAPPLDSCLAAHRTAHPTTPSKSTEEIHHGWPCTTRTLTDSSPCSSTQWLTRASSQVDPDQLVQSLGGHGAHRSKSATSHLTPYSTRYNSQSEISKFVIPREGAPADAVHQMLKDELDLDGRPNLNLARCDPDVAT